MEGEPDLPALFERRSEIKCKKKTKLKNETKEQH